MNYTEQLCLERDRLQSELAACRAHHAECQRNSVDRENALRKELAEATIGRCVCSSCGKTVNNAWRDSNGCHCLTCLSTQRDEARMDFDGQTISEAAAINEANGLIERNAAHLRHINQLKDELIDTSKERDALCAELAEANRKLDKVSRFADIVGKINEDGSEMDAALLTTLNEAMMHTVLDETEKERDTLREQLRSAIDAIEELRTCLNYVLYARFPMGDKVCDHIPQEWYQRSYEVYEQSRSFAAITAKEPTK